ncbi:MAG: DUF3034 family protein [Acidiferrobacterales bacterium]
MGTALRRQYKQHLGALACYTFIATGNFILHGIGAAVIAMHPAEFAESNWYLRLPSDLPGVGRNYPTGTDNIQENAPAIKIRLPGMTSTPPQIAAGLQHPNRHDQDPVERLGRQHPSDADGIVAVTRVFPVGGMDLILEGTLR